MALRRSALAWLGFLLRCTAQNAFSGVWHLVDALSVLCPAGPGYATLTIQKPTTSEYDPHIFTVFRTAQNSVSLSFIAKDAGGKVVTDQLRGVSLHPAAAPYRQLSEQSRLRPGSANASEAEAPTRELWGMRRRMSSGSRRRVGGGGGGINLNPTTWFSPRRRTSFAPSVTPGSYASSPRRRISAAPGATGSPGYGAAGGSMRRRGTSAASGYGYSSNRRRRTSIGGSSSGYSNPYSSYMGSYGYPSTSYAMHAFGGHTPMSTSYGYSGMNAYQGSSGSGMSIAMAGGAGLLAGYVGSQLFHPYYQHHGYTSWGGYSRHDLYGMPCTSGPWSGSCSSCVSLYGGNSCNVMMSPKIDATRDDLMNTGFAPSEVSWPITVNITRVAGPDFNPSVLCPPQKSTDWSPPPMKQVFLTLSSLSQPSMSGAYVGHQEAAGGAGLFNLLLCCCCVGGCLYFAAGTKQSQETQFGPNPMGPMPGYQGGYAQPSQNPYWQGGGEAAGTQLAQPSTQSSGGFMTTAAPNGKPWSEYCASTRPEIGPNGSLTGRWGECLAWAVVFEHQDKSWERDPTYPSGGPAGTVIDAMVAQVPGSKAQEVGKAAEALEEQCRQAIQAGRPVPVINERV